MIERYSTTEMTDIWSERNKFVNWLKVEMAVNTNLIANKVIPINNLSPKLSAIDIDKLIARAKEIESETHHDLNAFVFAAEEICGEDGKWIHFGLTSSDVLDTATALMAKESVRVIKKTLSDICFTLGNRSDENVEKKYIARTHGQRAEIGKLSDFFDRFYFSFNDVNNDYTYKPLPGKISGAIGDNKYIDVMTEEDILDAMYLDASLGATQVVQRNFYAKLMFQNALAAATVERLALQIRLYQQSDIEEMFEPFERGQTGSSAMPHKHNPILCENLCGLARLVRSYVAPSLEDMMLWQERDMTHSSVERITLPDSFNLLHFMLLRMKKIIDGLVINYNQIEKHVEEFKEKDTQREMLQLIRDGKGRQEAYRIIQSKTAKEGK